MSLLNNPSIVTNGLVFYYDMYNARSYRSPPLRNVLTEIAPRGQGDSATYKFSNGTENVFIPGLGYVYNCPYMDMYNDYYGGSNNCCPSPYGYGQGLSVSGSTEYTYAIVYKSVNGYTHPNYMYHYEYNGGTYITEYGVFYTNGTYSGSIRHLGDDWYWASAMFTTNANCNLIYTGAWMYEYARYNRLYVAKAMIVQGNYLDLHPRFWPALGTTVSNTQTVTDLTNNNTITATNLTYANDGTFSWSSGIDARLQASSLNFSFWSGNFTLECWIKPTNFNSYTHMIALPDQNTFALKANVSDGAIYFYSPGFTTYPTPGWTLTAGAWNHVVMTKSSGVAYCFLNGVLKGSKSGFSNSFSAQTLNIGNGYTSEYTAKSIASVKIYNTALTDLQVNQNFNAHREKYGL